MARRRPPVLTGPRGYRFAISNHAAGRWAERLPDAADDLEHAVRFGRVIARQPNIDAVAVYYGPADAVMVCQRAGSVYVVKTVVPYTGSAFHRAATGLGRKQWDGGPTDTCPACGRVKRQGGPCKRKKCPAGSPPPG